MPPPRRRRGSTGRCSWPATRTRCRRRRSTPRSRCSAPTGSTSRRRRGRLHADARALARDPHPQSRRRAAGRRDRADAVAQPARGRRLQVQPAAAAARPTPTITKAIEHEANRLIEAGLTGVERGATRARRRTTTWRAYVDDLPNVIDLDAIRARRRAHRRRPAGRRERRLLRGDRRPPRPRTSRSSTTEVDPTFRFMPLDHDGKIRMDCSSPYAMAGLLELRDRFDVAVRLRPRRRPPRDRHPERRAAEPQPLPGGGDPLPVRRRAAGLARRRRRSARRSSRAR